MTIAGRRVSTILRALTQRQHYVAAATMMKQSGEPVRFLSRYLLGTGRYPCTTVVRTPIGSFTLKMWGRDDVLEVNEIFFRQDCYSDARDQVIVEFGAGIGIGAAYFLSRSSMAFAYLYEPLPQNAVRLRENLRPFEGRYRFEPVAVGPADGEYVFGIGFGREGSGRYVAPGQAARNALHVPCRDAGHVVEDILRRHGCIDVLKIGIETLEEAVVRKIAGTLAARIKNVYVGFRFPANPLANTHHARQYGRVCQFTPAMRAPWPSAPAPRALP